MINLCKYMGFCDDELFYNCPGQKKCDFYKDKKKQTIEKRRLRRETRMYMIMNCID